MKNYVFMMAMMLFAVIAFTGCSDDENGLSGNAGLLIGTWQSQYYEWYRNWNGSINRNEGDSTNDLYTFRENGTGLKEDLEYPEYGYAFTWEIESNVLSIIDDGEAENYTIERLDADTLILVFSERDGNYEEYTRSTYVRVE